jgi:hypothetical protein
MTPCGKVRVDLSVRDIGSMPAGASCTPPPWMSGTKSSRTSASAPIWRNACIVLGPPTRWMSPVMPAVVIRSISPSAVGAVDTWSGVPSGSGLLSGRTPAGSTATLTRRAPEGTCCDHDDRPAARQELRQAVSAPARESRQEQLNGPAVRGGDVAIDGDENAPTACSSENSAPRSAVLCVLAG